MNDISGFDLLQLLRNIADQMPGVFMLVQACCYFMGVYCTWLAIKSMVNLGSNGVARADVSAGAPVWAILSSALLFAMPSTLAMLGTSAFGSSQQTSPLAYTQLAAPGAGPLGPIVPILQVIGLIAVLRGIGHLREVGMAKSWAPGRAHATPARGFYLVGAGMLLIHLKDTLGAVSNLTGLSLGAGLF